MSNYIYKKIKIDNNLYWYDFMTGRYGKLDNNGLTKDKENDVNYEEEDIILKCTEIMNNRDFMCINVMITGACNFRCAYCFETHDDNFISNDAIQNICRMISEYKKRNDQFTRLIVIWFGGEPTLRMDFILDLNRQIKSLVEHLDIAYTSRIISNGYLINKIIPYIEELNLSDIQITLDGPIEVHNKRRIHVSGKKTFLKIIENIKSINRPIDLVIRVNVDTNNISTVYELYVYLRELSINENVKVFFQPMLVENYGGQSSCYLENILTDRRLYVKYLNLLKDIRNGIETPCFLGAFCNVDFPGAFVITSTGKVVKCWADINDSQSYNISIYDTNPSEIIQRFDSVFFKPKYKRCMNCCIFPSCLGGCKYAFYSDEQCKSKKELMILQAQYYIEENLKNEREWHKR